MSALQQALMSSYGSVAAIYNPATQFGGGTLGLWYDPSDYAALSQDSAGATPVTAAGQTAGRMLDKSGRGNTYSQATAAARPLTATSGAIQSLTFDGVDDGGGTGAATFSADMDCFIAVRRATTAKGILLNGGSGTKYFGYFENGGGVHYIGAGAVATTFLNGVAVAGGTATTGATLIASITVGDWFVLEVRNLDLSTWTSLSFTPPFAGYFLNGNFGGMILAPAGDAATRTNNRQFLGAKVGLSL